MNLSNIALIKRMSVPQHNPQAKALYNAKGLSVKDIYTLLGIGKTTFYRYLNQEKYAF